MNKARKPVPLVKAYDPPPEPPDGAGARARRASEGRSAGRAPYAGEWIVDGKLERDPAPRPMPWPEAVVVEEDGPLFVSFGPVPTSEFIEVRVFGEALDADGTHHDQPPRSNAP